MHDISQLLHQARHAAIEAGKAIMEVYHSGDFGTAVKDDDSPLTIADMRAHDIIVKYLAETNLPLLSEESTSVEYAERKKWSMFWLVDPLDGTKEFIKKSGDFTVNIALIHNGKPIAGVVYAPVTDALYYGSQETGVFKIVNGIETNFYPLPKRIPLAVMYEREQVTIAASRSHLSPETKTFIEGFKNVSLIAAGSSIKFMLVMEGKADIYPRLGRTMEWDTAAAQAILNAVNRGIYHIDMQSELSYNKPDLGNPHFIAL